jgi:very-short-patch-repair endonuclease
MQSPEMIAGLVAKRGGTALVKDLRTAGIGPDALKAAVSSGAVTSLRRGLVGTANADPNLRTAMTAGGLITCVSAARELGLWTVKDPTQLHLWTDHGKQPETVVKHRGSLVDPGRWGYVGIVDCVLHAIRCRPRLEALVIAESAVRLGRISKAELLDRLPGTRNSLRRQLVQSIGLDADSPLEVIARDLFRAAGLHVETQVRIRGLGRVDMVAEGRLIIELDGFDFHWDRATFLKDRRRNNAGMLSGLPTLRYVYEDLVFTPERVVAEVLTMLRRSA